MWKRSSWRRLRDYEEVDGFAFAKRTHAVSDSLMLGGTELSIKYSRAITLERNHPVTLPPYRLALPRSIELSNRRHSCPQ
jgi:hypothetical protein